MPLFNKTGFNFKKNVGFTLVELLVVLAIIAILATVVITTFSEARARSRDSRRVSDVRVLEEALAMYIDKYSGYPIADVAVPGMAVNGSDGLSILLKNNNILLSVIADPLSGQPVEGDTLTYNYYYRTDSTGKNYMLTYCLETSSVLSQNQGCGNIITRD